MLSFTACSKITFNMNSDGFSGNMVEGRMMFKDEDSRCSFSFFCMNRSLGVEEGSCSVRGHDNSPPFISNSDPLPGRMGGGVEDWAYAVWQKKDSPHVQHKKTIIVRGVSITAANISSI